MMMTELNYFLFQESPCSFRHTQAFATIPGCSFMTRLDREIRG
jgi:hypothetical protein